MCYLLSVPGPLPPAVSHLPGAVLTPHIFTSWVPSAIFICSSPLCRPRLKSNAAPDIRPFQFNIPDIFQASTSVCQVTNGRTSPAGYQFPCLASLSRGSVVLLLGHFLLRFCVSQASHSWPFHLKGTQDLFLKSVPCPRQNESFPTCIVQTIFASILVKCPSFFLSLIQASIFLETCCVLSSVSGSRELLGKEATAAAFTERVVRGQTDPRPAGEVERWGNTWRGSRPPLGESAEPSEILERYLAGCARVCPVEKAEKHR